MKSTDATAQVSDDACQQASHTPRSGCCDGGGGGDFTQVEIHGHGGLGGLFGTGRVNRSHPLMLRTCWLAAEHHVSKEKN